MMAAAMAARFALLLFTATLAGVAAQRAPQWTPDVPRVWDESALAEWATPVARLNVRPTHVTAAEYDALPEENLRTYPVYLPGEAPFSFSGPIGAWLYQAYHHGRATRTANG